MFVLLGGSPFSAQARHNQPLEKADKRYGISAPPYFAFRLGLTARPRGKARGRNKRARPVGVSLPTTLECCPCEGRATGAVEAHTRGMSP